MGVGRRDEVAPAPHEPAMSVIGQRADFRYRPDWRGDLLRTPRPWCGYRSGDDSDGNGA
jgi:hypothetical protein